MANDSNLKPFQQGYDPRRGSKPKGAKNLSSWIKELMNDPKLDISLLDSKNELVRYKGAPIKALVRVAIERAITDPKDGLKWAEWLARYGYGSKIDVTSDEQAVSVPIYGGLSDPHLMDKEVLKW